MSTIENEIKQHKALHTTHNSTHTHTHTNITTHTHTPGFDRRGQSRPALHRRQNGRCQS